MWEPDYKVAHIKQKEEVHMLQIKIMNSMLMEMVEIKSIQGS